MKRFLIASAAILTLVGPLAATTAYAEPAWQYSDHRDDRGDSGYRDYGRGDYNDRGDDQGRSYNRGDGGRDWNGGWSHHQRDHRSWRRGDRMSFYDQRRFRSVDYRREHLRAPPRGYRYIQDDRGDTLLLGVATGVILGVILNGSNRY